MENKLIRRFGLLMAVSLTMSACSKPGDYAETANQRFVQSLDWNNGHSPLEILVNSDEYSILSMGDSHVGGTANLDTFLSIAEFRKPAAVVMAGDLTTGKSDDYTEFNNHIPKESPFPIFPVAGNHDLYYNGWEEFYNMFGSSTYYFSINTPIAKDLFICLETGGGTVGNKQLDWLINILITVRPGYRHCMVFTHTNFFRSRHTDSTNPLVEEVNTLSELFLKNRVDMVITGHDHKQDVDNFGTTTYIVMDALKDGISNAGYFQINMKNGRIEYQFEKL
jgi:predicted phosphodiesterase